MRKLFSFLLLSLAVATTPDFAATSVTVEQLEQIVTAANASTGAPGLTRQNTIRTGTGRSGLYRSDPNQSRILNAPTLSAEHSPTIRRR
jgi:hypothetical protein